jgi:hypothetical protein
MGNCKKIFEFDFIVEVLWRGLLSVFLISVREEIRPL